MLGNNRSRKKYYRNRNRSVKFRAALVPGLKLMSAMLLVLLLSIGCILGHDVATQCEYFQADRIEVEGANRLSEEDVLKQAQLYPGINILSVNLSTTRMRLLAHPEISKAAVSRTLPKGLSLTIKEHEPLAIIDFGRNFLMDVNGKIYKEQDKTDPTHLPLITGLHFSDAGNLKNEGKNPFIAVMNILHMGNKPQSILPNITIKRIHVDKEIGITLYVHDRSEKIRPERIKPKMIKIGYGRYANKYDKLKEVTAYLKKKHNIMDFDSIDLINGNRIVVNPIDVGQLFDNIDKIDKPDKPNKIDQINEEV